MKPSIKWLLAILAVIGLAAAAYLWWQNSTGVVPQLSAPIAPVQDATTPVTLAPEPVQPAAPAPIQHPIEEVLEPAASPPPRLPKLGESDKLIQEALTELLTRKAVLTFLNLDNFVRHFVATVDNLAQGHAASRLWPVVPTPGRFMVVERSDGTYVADGNSDRYTPFVRFASSVNTAQAAALYARLYPLFQQAYEELGYPGKYFNDRLVAVIDQLLDAPELTEPVRLTLTKVQGPIEPTQPWLRYEFEDPALEARPAGQKVMMRMGRANELLLKAKLKEFRERIVKRRSGR